jgi:UDP-glucose 4-epimerase
MDATEQHQAASEARLRAPLVVVTGASGFVGSFLASAFAGSLRVRTTGRRALPGALDHHLTGPLNSKTDWSAALEGVDAVVHAAGPAHAKYHPDELRRAIVDASAALAGQAARAGVKRLIYISSIHACVRHTSDRAVNEDTPVRPEDAYGRAKLEAELAVLADSALRPIVLRPPLVVGADAKGNFARLLRLLDTPLPLPFAGMRNKRNVISLNSLAAAVRAALDADAAAAGVFHVADQPALSTTEIAKLVRSGMGRPSRLFSAPAVEAFAPRALTQSLEIDDSRFRARFNYAGHDARAALVACGKDWTAR